VEDSSDFQEFSNLVENLAVTVENVGKKLHFTSSIVIRELLKKLSEYLRLQ
jgi:predicted transcriptional regulator